MINYCFRILGIFYYILLLIGIEAESATQDFENVQIQTKKIKNGIYMLIGRGGNIGVSSGKEGVFMIDDQYAPLTEKILAAVSTISDEPIRFVINTHWHQDHTDGNENMGEAGAIIVAHENVRKRLSSEQFSEFFNRKLPPSPEKALPVITFTRDVKFHLNDEEIQVFHLSNAHTDGDIIIYFPNSNVIHTGDIYFEGLYPFIDLSAGGSLNGMIEAVGQILPMINDDTLVIPGHGPLSNKSKLEAYHKMLIVIRDRISRQIRNGKSLEEVIASQPTQEFDEVWGKTFLKPEQFVGIAYKSLVSEQSENFGEQN